VNTESVFGLEFHCAKTPLAVLCDFMHVTRQQAVRDSRRLLPPRDCSIRLGISSTEISRFCNSSSMLRSRPGTRVMPAYNSSCDWANPAYSQVEQYTVLTARRVCQACMSDTRNL